MYQPPHFKEEDLETQHALIRAHPLGLLVTAGRSGLLANPVPFHLDKSAGAKGTLKLHLARANPQWCDIGEDAPVLAVFQGAQSYVTPSWYRTKQETGKVVPTWNYAIVQARGPARVVEDKGWLLDHIVALTAEHETPLTAPWTVDDAPQAFIQAQLKGIVGIEIEIEAIEGKWKVSQNKPSADRDGVAVGLDGIAGQAEMAEMVRRYAAARCGQA